MSRGSRHRLRRRRLRRHPEVLPGQRGVHRAVHRQPHQVQVRPPGRGACGQDRDQDHHRPGGRRRRAAGHRPHPELRPGPGDEHRPALPGPDHHGGLPGLRRPLHGHRQLRAGGHRRPGLARGLRGALQGGGFSAYFDYSWQWAYKKRFEEAGLTALLGCGFDPGVTQAYCAYAKKHEFDAIDTIDILDCNGGDHGYPFATNFNPEVNLREVSAPGSYWEDGHWIEVEPMSIHREYDFDQVGRKDMYLLHHEEIESLAKNLPEVRRIRFFMTFGQSYLTHMKCLENVGMLSTEPVEFEGHKIVPIQFLKALLPDPASLGPRTKGKTNIGCIFTGRRTARTRPTTSTTSATTRPATARSAARPSATPRACPPCAPRCCSAGDVAQARRLHRRGARPRSLPGRAGPLRPAEAGIPRARAGGLMPGPDTRARPLRALPAAGR